MLYVLLSVSLAAEAATEQWTAAWMELSGSLVGNPRHQSLTYMPTYAENDQQEKNLCSDIHVYIYKNDNHEKKKRLTSKRICGHHQHHHILLPPSASPYPEGKRSVHRGLCKYDALVVITWSMLLTGLRLRRLTGCLWIWQQGEWHA